jgi:hypothetical protein
VVWASKSPVDGFGFEPQNPLGVPAGMGGDMWRHHESCIEAEQSHEWPSDGQISPRVKWFSLNIEGRVGNVLKEPSRDDGNKHTKQRRKTALSMHSRTVRTKAADYPRQSCRTVRDRGRTIHRPKSQKHTDWEMF